MANGMRVTKAEVWAGDIEDQPGGLARVLEAMAGAGGSIECVVARRQQGATGQGEMGGGMNDGSSTRGRGDVFVSPVRGKRMQDAARQAGLTPADDMATLRIEGPDQPGLGGRVTRAIAEANVNMRGLTAAVIGRHFVAYLGFDSTADAEKAAKAIRGMSTSAGRAGARSTGRSSGRAMAARRGATAATRGRASARVARRARA